MKFSRERIARALPAKAGLLALMMASLGMFQAAHAAGTLAGTDITNTATVTYSVGAVSQPGVSSNTTTFKVDKKVNLTVDATVQTSTVPNATNVGLLYTVTNTGNFSDSFTLSAANLTGDNFDTVAAPKVYLDNGTTPGAWDAGDTQITAAVTLAPDTPTNYLIVGDIPGTATNGQLAKMRLTATTTSVATPLANPDTPGVEVVFADPGRDGTEFHDNQYNIVTAVLSAVKSSAVISDPINLTSNPKAIPSAVVEYTITVSNTGTADALSVVIKDTIPTNTTYQAGTILLNGSPVSDATGFTGTQVSVAAGTIVKTTGTATVKFRVTIN